MKELFTMTSIEGACSLLAQSFRPTLATETVPLDEAIGRVAAHDILAKEAVPAFDRSTKDGYAVRARDTFGASEAVPAPLTLAGEVLMGEEALGSLAPGTCRLMPTGGMLPPGADAVVMIEHTDELSAGDVLVLKEVAAGENVVRRGEDVDQADVLVPAGKRIRPQEAGLLASQGLVQVPVLERIQVGILSTGNEIVPADAVPGPGEIRDVNSYILRGEVRATGAQDNFYGIARDDYDALRKMVERALAENHMVLISGGSSVGTRDYCLQVLKDLTDRDPLFHGIPLKPGKPALGAAVDGKVLLGLPGHPVSARTVFDILGKPLLRTPAENRFACTLTARLARNVAAETGRDDHIKVRVRQEHGEYVVDPLIGLSGIVSLLTEGDGEIIVPAGTEGFAQDTQVTVHLF